MNECFLSNTVSPEVTAILNWWVPRIQDIFDNNLRGVFLFGGVALGEFEPCWSDVDTCVAVRSPVTAAQAASLNATLIEMDDLFGRQGASGWRSKQTVQGAVITLRQAIDIGLAEMCFYAWSSKGFHETCDPLSPFDRYQLAHCRKLISGNDVDFAKPERAALLEMTTKDLNSLEDAARNPEGYGVGTIASLLHWAARSLIFWRDGVLLAKSAALRNEINSGSPFAEAFQLALAVRERGREYLPQYENAIRNILRQFGSAICKEHTRLLHL